MLDTASIRDEVEAATRRAQASGALQPIPNTLQTIADAGVDFIVHAMPSLQRKAAAAAAQAAPANARAAANDDGVKAPARAPALNTAFDPFANPEADLLVGDLSNTHYLLLNKFNIIDRHLLVITKAFEHQESLLTEPDFEAVARTIEGFDGVAFYNGGAEAGASQAHKHLQLVPLDPPTQTLFAQVEGWGVERVPGFAFRHAFARLRPSVWDNPARTLVRLYRELLGACRIGGIGTPDGERQSGAYNLLLTRRWMLVVPRTQGKVESVHVSALCYAGSIFVRGEEDVEYVRRRGPMSILVAAAPAG